MSSPETVAVIVDIVNSRGLTDRSGAQSALQDAFTQEDARVPARQPIHPTVGDEFQGVYANLAGALVATTRARLALPAGVDCRFGYGSGEVYPVGAHGAEVQDGPGWWRAREAIERAHRWADGAVPDARSWFVAYDEPASRHDAAQVTPINAFLLVRDHVIASMSPRQRRLALGVSLGRTQEDLALEEGITQSAVSQAIRKSGVSALVAGLAEWSRVIG